MKKISDKNASDSILKQKFVKTLSKIEPQGVQMGPKFNYGGLTGGQAEEETFLKPSRTPQGPVLGNHLGVENCSTAGMEALPTRN